MLEIIVLPKKNQTKDECKQLALVLKTLLPEKKQYQPKRKARYFKGEIYITDI